MIITLSTENNIIKIIQFQYNIIRIDFKHLRARPSCLPKRNEKSCSKYEKLLKRCPSRKALAKAKAKIIHPGRHPWRHVSLWSQCDLNGSSLHLFCYQRLSRNATETHVKWQSIIKLRGKRTISAIGNLKALTNLNINGAVSAASAALHKVQRVFYGHRLRSLLKEATTQRRHWQLTGIHSPE